MSGSPIPWPEHYPAESIPTRIFCIGWQKTGTTSLHSAFVELGLSSVHCPYSIYPEIIAGNRHFSEVDTYYALGDLPIPLIYKELDASYPRSKFILTTRSTPSFLESVERQWAFGMRVVCEKTGERHWDKATRKGRYVHPINELAYGQREFDPVVFAERYDRHNSEVLEYFSERPNDLLVMDLDRHFEWEPLCGFLRKAGFTDMETPQTPFPHVRKLRNLRWHHEQQAANRT